MTKQAQIGSVEQEQCKGFVKRFEKCEEHVREKPF